MSGSNVIHIKGSAGASVTGVEQTINNIDARQLTQVHEAALTGARRALDDQHRALDELHPALFDALGQFLTIAQKTHVEVQNLAATQQKLKAVLDDEWAKKAAAELRPSLSGGWTVVKELAKSPAMAEVVKALCT